MVATNHGLHGLSSYSVRQQAEREHEKARDQMSSLESVLFYFIPFDFFTETGAFLVLLKLLSSRDSPVSTSGVTKVACIRHCPPFKPCSVDMNPL